MSKDGVFDKDIFSKLEIIRDRLFRLVKIKLKNERGLHTTYQSMAIYIAVYQLVPLRQVLRRKLGGVNKGTIKLKKILDKEVAEFVCF